jgi:hypothetical protein
MNRTQLMGAASAAALACLSTTSFAATGSNPQSPAFVQGGGSTLAYYDYLSEFSAFNAGKASSVYSFGTYLSGVGSGTGQQGLIQDDYSCDTTKSITGTATCSGYAPGTSNTVDYGASDAVLTTGSGSQISSWATSSVGQALSGNLIQLPALGVGVGIVVNNSAITTNGQLALTVNDVCAVFSGLYTDFSQITDTTVKPTPGKITVTYRSDSSGTSFLMTNFLASQCNSTDTAAGVTFVATTKFATLFKTLPSNFNAGESGGGAVANFMGCSGTTGDAPPSSAITYSSPDYTSLITTSQASVCGSAPGKSPLIVASVYPESVTSTPTKVKPVLPTEVYVAQALTHVTAGTNTTPPSNATEGANPSLWVPVISAVSAGYPISGYTTLDFAQCYADPKVATAIIDFLTDHYGVAAYETIQKDNGFVPIANTKSAAFATTIKTRILKNSTVGGAWNTNINNTTVCAGIGR